MKYLLDTNTCIYALKLLGRVVERLRERSPDEIGVSIVTVAELWFGARKSRRPAATRREIDAFLAPLAVVPFDAAAADAYASIRMELEAAGRPIGERDLLIAAIALAHRLTVITRNGLEFSRVPDLQVEDWY
ncbi:MAG: PIN domain-containing protein [Vicinamibacteria bacterium]|nr:PIN domain-containing protein [Vicinamibacteria bacterium]